MAGDALSLPVDIPWRRIGVSEDMTDPAPCDRTFPFRWRSSLALFAYEPPPEEQAYDDLVALYIKVTATITGFQTLPEDAGLRSRQADTYWEDPVLVDNYLERLQQYYACHGALVEVAVSPVEDGVELSAYPYLAGLEPKKREIFEAVSETGETLSRSLEGVSVKKGTTTTEGREDLHETAVSASLGLGIGPVQAGGGLTEKWGSKDTRNEQREDTRTTESSREGRETNSHTTQLTQMYHELLSYHLGTNRALYLIFPRPHIAQPKWPDGTERRTFVNGPRELEGVQELFFTVLRPASSKGVCVDAYLETAHVADSGFVEEWETKDDYFLSWSDLKVPAPLGKPAGTVVPRQMDSPPFPPLAGWEFDPAKDYAVVDPVPPNGVGVVGYGFRQKAPDHVTLWGGVEATVKETTFIDSNGKPHTLNVPLPGELDLRVRTYLRRRVAKPVTEGGIKHLWLTGRGVCACTGAESEQGIHVRPHHRESVTYETLLPTTVPNPVGGPPSMNIEESNRLRLEIGRAVRRSVHSRDRYAYGAIQFVESQFVGTALSSTLGKGDHVDNQVVTSIPGLPGELGRKISAVTPDVRRGTLLRMSPVEQEDRYELSAGELRSLRRALVGLGGREPDPKRRWGDLVTQTHVPDVREMSVADAGDTLRDCGLRVGTLRDVDSRLPQGFVAEQRQQPGDLLPVDTGIDLGVAAGATIVIPEVVGSTLSEALVTVRSVGIEEDPHIVLARGAGDGEVVIAVEPASGEYATRLTTLTLVLGSRRG